ncbi:MAG: hypothetical protein PHQ52_04250 [Candidatus Omnitrophica bacterium]|nr:hypothetical protein [Candidatus Omnitrophota bacterium]
MRSSIIKRIARDLGVSRATVLSAMDTQLRCDVTNDLLKKIYAAIRPHHYAFSLFAKG